jgi:hypothetical protein
VPPGISREGSLEPRQLGSEVLIVEAEANEQQGFVPQYVPEKGSERVILSRTISVQTLVVIVRQDYLARSPDIAV